MAETRPTADGLMRLWARRWPVRVACAAVLAGVAGAPVAAGDLDESLDLIPRHQRQQRQDDDGRDTKGEAAQQYSQDVR